MDRDKIIRPLAKGDIITHDHFEQSRWIDCYADRDLPAGHVITDEDVEHWTAEEIAEADAEAMETWLALNQGKKEG